MTSETVVSKGPRDLGCQAHVVTIDEMYHMPRDGQKYELIGGEVKVSPAGMNHELIGGELYFLLRLYLQKHKIGRLFTSSVGFLLPNGDLVSPDVSFVRTERLPDGKVPDTFGNMAPDLAVEIVSPFDRLTEVEDKAELYLSNGTLLVWVITPRTRRATVYRSGQQSRVLQPTDALDGEDVLPGFSCIVNALFDT